MKTLVLALVSTLSLTAGAYDFEYKYEGRFFEGEESRPACVAAAKALAHKLENAEELEKMTILEANCIESSFFKKGHKVLISYMAPMSLEIKDFTRTYTSEAACESHLTQTVNGMNQGDVFVADSYCRERSKKFELNVTYVNSNYKSFDTYEFSPYFTSKAECLDYASQISDTLESFDATPMLKGCQGRQFGTQDRQVYYSVNIDHLIDVGQKVYALKGKRIADDTRCLDDAREIKDRFNNNKIQVVDVFCQTRSKTTHQYITYINKLIDRVKKYRGTTYDSEQACKVVLKKISTAYEARKRKVLYSYCDTTVKGSTPVIHFLRPEIKL